MRIKSALLVHDDPEEGAIWAHLLGQLGLNVVSISSDREDLEHLEDKGADLVIVNTHRAEMDTIEICRQLRSEFVNPILLLAPDGNEERVLEAFKAGVDDYIPTSIGPRIFLAKVRAWTRRSWTVSAVALENLAAGQLTLDPARRQLVVSNRSPIKLTNLEFRVLHLLMTHAGQVLESSFITDCVWGYAATEESVLLKNVIYRLRRKIEIDPAQPFYIKNIPGSGYMLCPA
jgi:DNA-binding response OmpR family regulator